MWRLWFKGHCRVSQQIQGSDPEDEGAGGVPWHCILITVTLPPHWFLPDPLLLPLGWQNTESYTSNSYTPTPIVPPSHHPASTWLTKKYTKTYTSNSYTPTPTFPLWPSPSASTRLPKKKHCILITVTLPPQHSLPHTILLPLGWQNTESYTSNSYTFTPIVSPSHHPAFTWLTKKYTKTYTNNSYTPTPTFPL